MHRKTLHLLAALFVVVLGLLAPIVSVRALEAVEDRQNCTITLLMGEGVDHTDNPMPDGIVTLYAVAGVSWDGGVHYDASLGQFAASQALAGLSDMSHEELDDCNASLADRLSDEVEAQGLMPLRRAVISHGTVRFRGLPVGLYLVYQTEESSDDRFVEPFLLSVPDAYGAYDVVAGPKPGIGDSPSHKPDDPSSDDPSKPGVDPAPDPSGDDPDDTSGDSPDGSTSRRSTSSSSQTRIPQTGQLWWPVPLMVVLGTGLCAFGLSVLGGKRSHE